MSSLKVSKRNCPIWDKLIAEVYGVIDREPNLEHFFQKAILGYLKELDPIEPTKRINDRIEKYSKMGVYK